jgi:epoxyqueuosine reductase
VQHGEQQAEKIRALAREAGYADCGFCAVAPFAEYARAVRERMARFPSARALYEPMLARSEPQARAPWARSAVVCIRRYGKYRVPDALAGHIGRTYLFDRRVADCPDHEMPAIFGEGLKKMGLRVRRGGLPDRWAAVRAGVARFGKNGFAYARCGSWCNIESWLTDAELPPGQPALDSPCPPGCRACIDACPTHALTAAHAMRMDRCVAWLTYSAPEPIADDLWQAMGPWIYGCDRCQEVCPLNRGQWRNLEKAAWLEPLTPRLTPAALAVMDDATYRAVVHPLFWYIPEDGAERWRRNARRALAHARRGHEVSAMGGLRP